MILGAVLLVASAVLLTAVSGLVSTTLVARKQVETRLLSELQRLQARLGEHRTILAADLDILRQTPATLSLIALENQGAEGIAQRRVEYDLWKDSLEQSFASFLIARSDYLQIRLIRLGETAREVVRVRRVADGVEVVPTTAMRTRPDAPYVAAGTRLAVGQFHIISPVWQTTDSGEIATPRLAMSQMITPVFGDDGRQRGLLVIDYATVPPIERALALEGLVGDVLMVNKIGASYIYDHARGSGAIYLHHDAPLSPEAQEAFAAYDGKPEVFAAGDKLFGVRELGVPRPKGQEVLLAKVASGSVLGGPHRDIPLVLAGIGLLATFVSAFLTRHFTAQQLQPILTMKAELQRAVADRTDPELPLTRDDEIGALAGSFDALLQRIKYHDARATAVLDGVRDGVVVIDDQGVIVEANSALHQMLGHDEGALTGHPVDILIMPAERLDHTRLIAGHLTTGRAERVGQTVEERAYCKDGTSLPIELSVSRLTLGDMVVFAAVIRDISARQQRDRERHDLINALERSNAELEEFAYIASHDLQAPLRSIDVAASWLETDLDDRLDEDSRDTLKMMRLRVTRMSRLLADLLGHAQIGRKLGETESPVILGSELKGELLNLLSVPPGFRVTFSPRFEALLVRTMPLRSVLLNLISNALKHHDRESGEVEVDVETDGAWLRFTVRDDGPGIDPAYHERAFGLFQTLQSRDRREGSGMGLAFCRKTVDLAGGQIRVLSQTDTRGVTFEFTWPVKTTEDRSDAA